MPENKNIETLPFDNVAATQFITLDKYDYDRLRENTAKLKAIENLAIEDEVVNGDVILAICGVSRKMAYEYHVDTVLEAGEYLEIDSAAETVTKILTSGIKVNAFHYRSFENSVFRPIQVGRQEVFWDGKFDFDLILFEERSEPKWS